MKRASPAVLAMAIGGGAPPLAPRGDRGVGFSVAAAALGIGLGLCAEARVVSYAPVTDRVAVPAIQKRTNRHYLLMERDPLPAGSGPCGTCGTSPIQGHLVLYDSQGAEGPRAVFPAGAAAANLYAAAMHEDSWGIRILVRTNASLGAGDNPGGQIRWVFSGDGGATWTALAAAPNGPASSSSTFDRGGPVVRERGSQLRIGSPDYPFLYWALDASTGAEEIWAVSAAGQTTRLVSGPPKSGSTAYPLRLCGTSAGGDEALVCGAYRASSAPAIVPGVFAVDLAGRVRKLIEATATGFRLEGWITPGGGAYAEVDWTAGRPAGMTAARSIAYLDGASGREVALPPSGGTVFAVPAAGNDGVYVVSRTSSLTELKKHTPSQGLTTAWGDVTAPAVEALIPGRSGRRVLVQVNKPRPAWDQRLFRDPALAVWEEGQPAPKDYDELYLTEYDSRAFVHVDADAVAGGEPFVFDSGWLVYVPGGGPSGGGTGGSDVVQEWGVVRGSLRQKLVIPAVARTGGAFGSTWRSDVVLRNPGLEPLRLRVRLGPNAGTGPSAPLEVTLTLAPDETRVVKDVLGTLFGLEHAAGALYLVPEGTGVVNASSRTYTEGPNGSYGMGVPAVDVFAAASVRFPLFFSAAVQAGDFRTNFVVADAGGSGAAANLDFVPELYGLPAPSEDRLSGLSVRPQGQTQLNGVQQMLSLPSFASGALVYRPESGESVAGSILVDNRTNDPTWFPPDLPSPVVRIVPAIVHADGSLGSRYRSDLFMVNASDQVRTVALAARLWESAQPEAIVSFTMLPGEARTIRDVLRTLFGLTGVARLRYTSMGASGLTADGIRLTTRAYNVSPDGGTFGNLVPPINSFQAAGPGEAIEILGVVGGTSLRTNLAIVELAGQPTGTRSRVRVEVRDQAGREIDRFELAVPVAGGLQVDDLFRARQLGNGPEAAVIRIVPIDSLVTAYATVIDNGTNDPTYYGPALLASY